MEILSFHSSSQALYLKFAINANKSICFKFYKSLTFKKFLFVSYANICKHFNCKIKVSNMKSLSRGWSSSHDGFRTCPKLIHLDFNESDFTKEARLQLEESFPHVKDLITSLTNFTEDQLNRIVSKMKALETLIMNGTQISLNHSPSSFLILDVRCNIRSKWISNDTFHSLFLSS